MPIVCIDGEQLRDWESFHTVFATAFGFPAFFGRTMNAWIECMTSLDSPDHGMTLVHGSATDPVVLRLDHADVVPRELMDALADCSAFLNWRRLEGGEPAILV